jgi:hypothetical protein
VVASSEPQAELLVAGFDTAEGVAAAAPERIFIENFAEFFFQKISRNFLNLQTYVLSRSLFSPFAVLLVMPLTAFHDPIRAPQHSSEHIHFESE